MTHKGDEKWMQKWFKTLHSAVSNFVCIARKATAPGPGIYTEHGPTTSHRATLLSIEQFLEHVSSQQTFMRTPGFSRSFVQPDWLHICLIELIEEGDHLVKAAVMRS